MTNKEQQTNDTPIRGTGEVKSLVDKFNAGAPIPPVSAADIKQMREAIRRMNADMPPRPSVATSLAVFAAYGVEAASGPLEQFMAIQNRHGLMSALVERGVLNDYMHGEELDEKVFRAAATMPCNRDDMAEAMLPRLLTQVSAEDAEKAKKGMRAEGHDPDKPNVDIKFLDWLSNNC